MKMTHKEEGIHRRYVCQKKNVFREKLRCYALDIQV
jgi:hypothetical protein